MVTNYKVGDKFNNVAADEMFTLPMFTMQHINAEAIMRMV